MKAARSAPAFWRNDGAVARLLWPLSQLFGLLSRMRRQRQQRGAAPLPVPVVVVGNISVGGSGKTPVVDWLITCLREAGVVAAIISRGYGGALHGPHALSADSTAQQVGDEAAMLYRRCRCPVVIGRDRVAAARYLLQHYPETQLIVSDDGLQHYSLYRDIEIAVVDPLTLGNRRLLPAGPLRESLSRLNTVDMIIAHGALDATLAAACGAVPVYSLTLQADELQPLGGENAMCDASRLQDWVGKTVHAVAGIGRPERFFQQLRCAGIEVITHPFPDHHVFSADDFADFANACIFMTSKDAIKCRHFMLANAWEVPVAAQLDNALGDLILEKIAHGRSHA